ncbi:MAG: hypothetical protein IPJ82_14375 [Lewinellaceae bacterium]|nr:hypothetical protein [Lewinellaceae bacterium]
MKPVITIAIAFCLMLTASAQAQRIKIDTLNSATNTYRFRLVPTPTVRTTIEPGDPGWVYFWMFSDSTYSDVASVTRTFKGGEAKRVGVSLRGKYTNDQEPPAHRIMITPETPGFNPVINLPTDTILRGEIKTQWGAARMGDTIRTALIIRNYSGQSSMSGYLKIRYPNDVFEYVGEVFPPDPAIFGNAEVTTFGPFTPYSEGIIRKWTITNLPPNSERTIFAIFKVKGASNVVRYGTQHRLGLDYVLESSGINSDNPNPDAVQPVVAALNMLDKNAAETPGKQPAFQVTAPGDNRESGAVNPAAFSETTFSDVVLSFARDPNKITVDPMFIRPGRYPDPIPLKYTIEVENLGKETANTIEITSSFDQRIERNTISNQAWDRPSCEIREPSDPQQCTVPQAVQLAPNAIKWVSEHINLFPFGTRNSDLRKAYFRFDILTQSGLNLKNGDRITTSIEVLMKNNNGVTEDSVVPPPAITYVVEDRVPFGCVLGAKLHVEAPGAAAPRGSGLSLTLRCPLYRPSGNSFSDPLISKLPRLFWQFELGGGSSEFKRPADGSVYKTNYIQVTPVQIRYMHPVNVNNLFRYVGVSAGYTAHFITGAKLNGSSVTLPGGFDKKIEHELSASIDLMNRINVPGFTLGAGYKYRQNKVSGQKIEYNFPFVYLQVDVVRFYRRFVQVWDKVL